MAEAVANVARRINATVEEGKDSLGKTNLTHLSHIFPLSPIICSQFFEDVI